MTITIAESSTRDGPIFTLSLPGGPGVSAQSVSALATSDDMAARMRKLRDRLKVQSERFLPDVLVHEIGPDVRPVIQQIGTEIRAGQFEARTVAQMLATASTIPDTIDRSRFDWIASRVAAMGGKERMAFIKAASATELAALLDSGQTLTGLAEHEWQAVQDRAPLAFHLVRSGAQARFPLKPALEGKLLVAGPDVAAAEADAREQFDAITARRDAIEAREQHLRRVISLCAALTARRPSDILAEALGNVAAAA